MFRTSGMLLSDWIKLNKKSEELPSPDSKIPTSEEQSIISVRSEDTRPRSRYRMRLSSGSYEPGMAEQADLHMRSQSNTEGEPRRYRSRMRLGELDPSVPPPIHRPPSSISSTPTFTDVYHKRMRLQQNWWINKEATGAPRQHTNWSYTRKRIVLDPIYNNIKTQKKEEKQTMSDVVVIQAHQERKTRKKAKMRLNDPVPVENSQSVSIDSKSLVVEETVVAVVVEKTNQSNRIEESWEKIDTSQPLEKEEIVAEEVVMDKTEPLIEGKQDEQVVSQEEVVEEAIVAESVKEEKSKVDETTAEQSEASEVSTQNKEQVIEAKKETASNTTTEKKEEVKSNTESNENNEKTVSNVTTEKTDIISNDSSNSTSVDVAAAAVTSAVAVGAVAAVTATVVSETAKNSTEDNSSTTESTSETKTESTTNEETNLTDETSYNKKSIKARGEKDFDSSSDTPKTDVSAKDEELNGLIDNLDNEVSKDLDAIAGGENPANGGEQNDIKNKILSQDFQDRVDDFLKGDSYDNGFYDSCKALA